MTDQSNSNKSENQLWLDPATECLPTWACDNDYYESLVKYEKVHIKTDPIKGKGLFARVDIEEGDHVLVETALSCSQNVDDFEAGIPICGSCMRSLETPKQIIRRLCGHKRELLNGLPKNYAGFKLMTPVPCKMADKGCTMVFCSERCHDDAWRKHHFVGCSGVMTEEGEKAYEELRNDGWVHNGVDLSDTVFLGFRFFSYVLTRHRLHRMPLQLAWFPVGQLICAPISKFSFSYLLQEEYEEAIEKKEKEEGKPPSVPKNESEAERRSRRWKIFAETKENQRSHPAVQFHLTKDDPDKVAFVKNGWELVKKAANMSETEAAFLTSELWSNLLGAILLNGQERSPHSQFTDFMSHWKKHEGSNNNTSGAEEVKKFAKLVRENTTGLTITDFETSTRGQGIYTVGSCFNHSCKPNLQIHYAGNDDEMLCAVALRDIKKDEELYISYIDEDMNIAERQQQLFEHYLFTCACEKCEEQKAERARHQQKKDEKEEKAGEDVPLKEE